MVGTASAPGRVRRLALSVGLVALAVVVAAPVASAAGAKTKLASKSSSGVQGNDDSHSPETNGNGRFIAFGSDADNLVSNDNNGVRDIFVFDRKKRKTKRVSVTSAGVEGDARSLDPSISADGRYVLFTSEATDMVTGDNNGFSDVFVHDRKTKKTKRISVKSNGDEGDGSSFDGSISASGRIVAFSSVATNLISSDGNGAEDVFVHDRKTKKTKRVSVKSNGAEGNDESGDSHISANGRFVAFVSDAENLVSKDTNLDEDVFVHDRKKKKTKRVSVKSNGKQGNDNSWDPTISATGRYIAFTSEASNFAKNDDNGDDVFVHDRATKKTKMVSVNSRGKRGNQNSSHPSISANGRWVVFESGADNLVKKDTNGEEDVFMRDRASKKTKRISVKSNGAQAKNGQSDDPGISGDGRWVVFETDADNLFGSDANGDQDIVYRGQVN